LPGRCDWTGTPPRISVVREVRKLDAVVRLGGGGRLRWDRITAE
jgi:hypothetical protein